MTSTFLLGAADSPGVDIVGGKGHGLLVCARLGLPVPPGFVIGTDAWQAWSGTRTDGTARPGARLPDEVSAAVAAGLAHVEAETGRTLGGDRPLVVSVRSGSAVSMPGMLSTVLDVGLTTDATTALAAETGDEQFAGDCRRRLREGWATVDRHGAPPDDASAQVEQAVAAVLDSWGAPRARTYRLLHGIPDDAGTAVVVQAMVFGNRDARSGSAVVQSRDPLTGAPGPVGDALVRHQGADVVDGTSAVRPVTDLAAVAPDAWADLRAALDVLERRYRDAVEVEVTVESGRLWLLQVRRATLSGRAAVRVAVDLVDEGLLDRGEAVRRVTAAHLRQARVPHLDPAHPHDVVTRGTPASPGVAAGRVALTSAAAVRLAVDGPVLLVRPETSPEDLPGFRAAVGVLTARGGASSHAAVVARSLGLPAVVGAADVEVDVAGGVVRVGRRTVTEGDLLAADGSTGLVVAGTPRVVTGGADDALRRLLDWVDEATAEEPAEEDG